MIFDCWWLHWHFFPRAYKPVLLPGLLSLSNGCSVAVPFYAGEDLNQAKFPSTPTNLLPTVIRYLGVRYPPDSTWLTACIVRIKYCLLSRLTIVVVRQIASDLDMLYDSNNNPNTTEIALQFRGITVTQVSGFIPANYVSYWIVTPERHALLSLIHTIHVCFPKACDDWE